MSCKLRGFCYKRRAICTRDTLSVVGHTDTVIAVYILFHRVTKYILYSSRLQEVYASLVTCSIHPRIHWRHCTVLFV